MFFFPKISIVTPSFNLGDFIEQTISSVVNQGYPNLEYIIVDGGSTDDTLSIIKKYENQITKLIAEHDTGMYDAINKGFSHATGDIMGWINADDILHHKSLFSIADIFTENKDVSWIQGHPTVINQHGQFIMTRQANNSPWPFLSNSYDRNSFIQQESTFWRRTLYVKAGDFVSQEYKLAGDFELWMRFFRFEKLHNVNTILSSFRIRENQLSHNEILYFKEVEEIIDKEQRRVSKVHLLKNKVLFGMYRIAQKISQILFNRLDKSNKSG